MSSVGESCNACLIKAPMNILLNTIVSIALIVHVLMILVSLWRVGRGDNALDRLMGLDLLSTLMLAVLVLMSIFKQQSLYIDVALGLAALSYIGTIAFGKYIADHRMY